jgi:translation initiation factor 2B subunit (eIF-2B alpha/beta/delta family)
MQNTQIRIAQVRDDREHGSRWLVRESLLIIHELAHIQVKPQEQDAQLRQIYQAAQELARARPAMAALASAVSAVISVRGGADAIAREAERLLHEYDVASERIAEHAAPLVRGTIMTCSISGTVVEVLSRLKQTITHVIALEGRPRYEGRDMARALSQQGIAVTLITDAQADIFLPQCQSVIVGADSVLAGGDVLNKAGTALLAWAARGHNVPFYALCETLKISPQQWSDQRLDLLEEKEALEVLAQPIDGVTVRNFYFDHTPHFLLSGLITERGALDGRAIQAIADRIGENEQYLATL